MCNVTGQGIPREKGIRTVPVADAVGMVLAHDVTEIRKEFKGRAFKKGHVIRKEDVGRFLQLGKENVYVLSLGPEDMHENEAAVMLAASLSGEGVEMQGEPREGRVDLVAGKDGLLMVNRPALLELNMLGDVICATRHGNTMVRKGRVVAGTRAIPLTVKRSRIEQAAAIGERARTAGAAIIRVKQLRRAKAGLVITGTEVYYRRVEDIFGPLISGKITALGGEIIGIRYAPDEANFIQDRLRELVDAGADLLLTTGGMSVDPDDVTRFAIANLGAKDIVYGSPVLPGSMFLIGYIGNSEFGIRSSKLKDSPHSEIPVLGIPASALYHSVTVLDLILPRMLAGEKIGRRELADLGHGGLCLHCRNCRYPVCPFGK